MKGKAILDFTVKVLKAILYVLSAGHLCSCKGECRDKSKDK